MTELKEIDLLDKDIDSAISTKELRDKEMINKADQNSSQKIEVNIIIIFFVKKMKNPTIEKELYESLKRFDKDNNGVISYDELINIMIKLGVNLIEEEADRMIREKKSLIISDLKKIIGIISFSVVLTTVILLGMINDVGFVIVGKVLLLLWIIGVVVCIIAIIISRREYKKDTKVAYLIKKACSSINGSLN